jgi:hypothetical protein
VFICASDESAAQVQRSAPNFGLTPGDVRKTP